MAVPLTPKRIFLARTPTPLERPRTPRSEIDLLIKRDDLTGAALSGNKVRKLEFVVAEALDNGADTLITCGGIQSNHARATALAAATLGLKCILFLRGEKPDVPDGNTLLDEVVGADIRYITPAQYRHQRNEIMAEEADRVARRGGRAFVIAEGASSATGCWGYLTAVAELKDQLNGVTPDYLVCATGSGGTHAGLLLGTHFHMPQTRVLSVNVCDDEAYFRAVVGRLLEEFAERFASHSLGPAHAEFMDGYVGGGYALNTPEELTVLLEVARSTGLILDPVYTLKAWIGLHAEVAKGRIPPGSKVVFFHTGGLFGLFPKRGELPL